MFFRHPKKAFLIIGSWVGHSHTSGVCRKRWPMFKRAFPTLPTAMADSRKTPRFPTWAFRKGKDEPISYTWYDDNWWRYWLFDCQDEDHDEEKSSSWQTHENCAAVPVMICTIRILKWRLSSSSSLRKTCKEESKDCTKTCPLNPTKQKHLSSWRNCMSEPIFGGLKGLKPSRRAFP